MTIPAPYELPIPTLASRLHDASKVLADPHLNPATRIRFAHSHIKHAQSMLRPSTPAVLATLRAVLVPPSYLSAPDQLDALLGALDAAGIRLVFK